MLQNIFYSEKNIQLEINEDNLIKINYPEIVQKFDENEIIVKSISNPINSKPFSEYIKDDNNFLFIVNDGARPTPTAKILKHTIPLLKGKNIKFIVATGAHRNPSESELKIIFGNYLDEFRNNIISHNAKCKNDNIYFGKTSLGTEIYFNKIISEYKKIICISSVEPHYFAGYTGGRKSFVPGIASYETIEHNHKFSLDKNSEGLKLRGNPVNDDMEEALKFLVDKDIFSIQIVLSHDRKIYSVHSGNINDSFTAAVNSAKKIYCATTEEKADIVLAVAWPPTDSELYQAHKAIEHGKLILKHKGILILIAQCKEGIGPQGFYDLLSSCNSPDEVLQKISMSYKLGYHKAAKIAELLTRANIWIVTDLDKEITDKIFMKKYTRIEDAVNDGLKEKGDKAKIAILNDAGNIVPILK